MHKYFIKTPWIVSRLFPDYVWRMPVEEKIVYLTFDDGPHPHITEWVMEQLWLYDAEATFFCIGKNVQQHPEVYQRLIREGHAVGNHTQHHLNGWKVDASAYLADIAEASANIESSLFRPPYGRLRSRQAKGVAKAMGKKNVKIIMWDVLSGDFDSSFSAERCLLNVTEHVRPGSIVVFHDSEKAFPNLKQTLPKALDFLKNEGYILKKIEP